jgi:hypothetical protein
MTQKSVPRYSQIREQLPQHRKQDALKTVGHVTGDQTSSKQASPAFFLDDLFRRVDCDNPPQISGLDLAQIDLNLWGTDRIRRWSRAPAGMS